MVHTSGKIPATLIPGDGIGPEIIDATVMVLEALGSPFEWDVRQAGSAAMDSAGDPLPAATLISIRERRLALKGPLKTPRDGGFRSSSLRLREAFELFANVRPVTSLIPGRFDNIDVVMVRENLSGYSAAQEYYVPVGNDPRAVAVASGSSTREGGRRIARFAFDYALRCGRRKITLVHQAHILKALSGIFLEAAQEVATEYQGQVELEEMIADTCAMQLVLNPWRFDMLLCSNLCGDILADQLAGLAGGLGMVPGANFGSSTAIFEAVHGAAPDIAGQGTANPVSMMLAAAMMLDHVELHASARRLRQAINTTLNGARLRTSDLEGSASIREFGAAVCQHLMAL